MMLSGFLSPVTLAQLAGVAAGCVRLTLFFRHPDLQPAAADTKTEVSGERLEGCVDFLQNLGFAFLAPVQRNHLRVGFDLVDVAWQLFEMIQ